MHPERVFEKRLVDNPTICNYCFRNRARVDYTEDELEDYPDSAVPIYSPSPQAEVSNPPNRTDERGLILPESVSRSRKLRQNLDRFHIEDSQRIEISHPTITCTCGRIDDERIDGGFPEDWNNRPKEKLREVGKRVYNRLDEQDIEVDFDVFKDSLDEYKTSDEYKFGDYEVLQKSVADSVSVKPEA